MIGVFQKDVSQYDFFEKIKVISIKKSYNKKYVKNESPKMAVFNTHAYIQIVNDIQIQITFSFAYLKLFLIVPVFNEQIPK